MSLKHQTNPLLHKLLANCLHLVRTMFYPKGTEAMLGTFVEFQLFKRALQQFITMSIILTNQTRQLQDTPLQPFYSFQQHHGRVRLVLLCH